MVKIVKILEVIKRHASLSLQFELERRELLSKGRWLLLPERRGEADPWETRLRLSNTLWFGKKTRRAMKSFAGLYL